MAGKVFISYRREDSAAYAGRIQDRLERELGREFLFIDVDNIPLGVNFVKVLREEVAACGVLLAVIGPNWLELRDEGGNRRLDDAHDFVRTEIVAALQRGIPVIPILLDDASIPQADQLPKELEELALRNGLYVRHTSFHNDMEKLIQALKGHFRQLDAMPALSLPPQDVRKVETSQPADESRIKKAESQRHGPQGGISSGTHPPIRLLRTLKGHRQAVHCLAIARDGVKLASGCRRFFFNPELWIWDIGRGLVTKKLVGHTTSVWGLAFSPDGSTLASIANEPGVHLWSVANGKSLHVLDFPPDARVLSISFSPDGTTLAAGTKDSVVRIWNCQSGQLLTVLEGHKSPITSVAFSADGVLLASASNRRVRVWRVSDWTYVGLGNLKSHVSVGLRTVAFSPDSTLLGVGSQLWRVSDWKLIQTLKIDSLDNRSMTNVAFSPDNQVVCTYSIHGDVRFWRLRDGELLLELEKHIEPTAFNCFIWLTNSSFFIGVDKSIQHWSWLRAPD